MQSTKNIVTRVAPSPTGTMHIGTARTALFNYLYARHRGGTFIVRIEDTDPARDKPEYEKDIFDALEWLGITADEKHRQSEYNDKHRAAIHALLEAGTAYISHEPAKENPNETVDVIRFKNPKKTVSFNDLLHGEISVDTSDLGDFVIARSETSPLHHLAVVVDDAAMGVTLAMRGEDLLSNTPRQILIQEALGLPRPEYAHLPLILGPDKTKLSKRRHAVSVLDYREKGYMPEALVNFLAFLGWNPGTDQELFLMQELIEAFDISGIQKSAAVFNEEKLRWFNREYILKLPEKEYTDTASEILKKALQGRRVQWDEEIGKKVAMIIRERVHVWSDITNAAAEGEYDYFFKDPELDPAKIPGKGNTPEEAAKHLAELRKLLETLPSSEMSPEALKTALWSYAEAEGKGKVLWPLRYALTGRERSPDPFTVAALVGKEAAIRRIDAASEKLV